MSKWRRNKSLTKRWKKNHLINKYNGICHICGLPILNKKDVTIDHFIPFSKGGFDELENYRIAHLKCNQIKRDMTPEEFKEFQKGGALVE